MSTSAVKNYPELVRKSKLVPEAELQAALAELEREIGEAPTNARQIANRLIEKDLITDWQNEKLMQGKHQGFFLGKYKLLRHISSGGMSSVYLAEHTMMRRQVAIKILPPARKDDSSFLERFHRECQVMASLDHPNIVRAHDFDCEKERLYYMVLEFIDGKDLQRLVDDGGVLDYVEAATYIAQAASALQHAHDQGMVHRDMKPANLMLDKRKSIKVLDLGVARITNSDDESSLTLAHNEDVLGTADFLAPEQALNSHHVDSRADVYALGCTLYYILCGHAPYANEKNLAKKLMCHQVGTPLPIRDDRSDLPDELEEILNKMMAKKREHRYQTMEEVIEALNNFSINQSGSPALYSRISPAPQKNPTKTESDTIKGSQADTMVAKAEPTPADEPAQMAQSTPTHSPRPEKQAAAEGASVQEEIATGSAVPGNKLKKAAQAAKTSTAKVEKESSSSKPPLLIIALGVLILLSLLTIIVLLVAGN
ncbi:Serine/threonine-protein kinase PrkC [Planctomycetales bacterium 10988]|nr:Serine/threonine-protein kinase PrkC [Planctomycetales bacterium 10988]